uniref:Glycine rich superfamily member n=1 Tax=Rhipicephalus zambeziensis TaxID=60191 RepID=A0A224YIW9_9ACAR
MAKVSSFYIVAFLVAFVILSVMHNDGKSCAYAAPNTRRRLGPGTRPPGSPRLPGVLPGLQPRPGGGAGLLGNRPIGPGQGAPSAVLPAGGHRGRRGGFS